MSRTARLPLTPPHFPTLNSYHRLLVHRLADRFGIVREVENAPPGVVGLVRPVGAMVAQVVVLVKAEASAL
jgi:hypothetical protein